MLKGMMMDRPLSIPAVIDYAADVYPDQRIVSATVEGGVHSYSYAESRDRIGQLAHALVALGVKPGDRVATLAWNGYRHFELYYAVAGIGAVCHTINPRLFPDQIAWIMGHAADSVLCFDLTFVPLVNALRPRMPPGIRLVALCDAAHRPDVPEALAYEDLLAGQPQRYDWPDLPEDTAAALCYTSGTTGDPKGALYSHRSSLLHAFSVVLGAPRSFGVDQRILPVVPLFHVNAWGLPYSAPLAATGLVFPGPRLDGASLWDLMQAQGVTAAWGVPTVWTGLIDEMRKRGARPDRLHSLLIGGSAAAPAMIRALEEEFGIEVLHGWGMTEMSPVGTVSRSQPGQDMEARIAARLPQGKRLFGVDLKIVAEDGTRLPHDGKAVGELLVRGPQIISGYYNDPAASARAFDAEGWFRTGDVARITPQGDLVIVDRTKDLIKSGGEWISSIDLENAAASHPAVAMAAAVAVPHPKWDERPVLAVVLRPGAMATEAEILAHIGRSMAKWQLPDAVAFVEAIPMTATGKMSKKDLRVQLQNHFRDSPGA
ncbi:MAG: long-chain-fatty-acid--CoA ligase [Gemmobacter sp.]|uniref:long-chain-fatty-acid--CoA ligase n=1 Tax=Gemmobacter sp. TaxID=1898957 RepID=UPI00391DB5EC